MTERFDVDFFAVCRQHNQPGNVGVADVALGDFAQLFCFHVAAMTGGAGEPHRALSLEHSERMVCQQLARAWFGVYDDVGELRVLDAQIALEVAGERVCGGESHARVGGDRQQRDRSHFGLADIEAGGWPAEDSLDSALIGPEPRCRPG
jgi:hypothetical protein